MFFHIHQFGQNLFTHLAINHSAAWTVPILEFGNQINAAIISNKYFSITTLNHQLTMNHEPKFDP